MRSGTLERKRPKFRPDGKKSRPTPLEHDGFLSIVGSRRYFSHVGTFANVRRVGISEFMPASGSLTTHVLDTMHGKPAAGMRIDLLMTHGDHSHHVLTTETNADGRVEEPLLGGERWGFGTFELVFYVGPYFARLGGGPTGAPFLDTVPVRFNISEDVHYHVPLLVSPYAYSTYRGS